MGCRSDYMEASKLEVHLSELASMIDEVDGRPINKDDRRGYHPRVYNKTVTDGLADLLTAELCTKLQNHPDIWSLSEMVQIWWNGHQVFDKTRIMQELNVGDREATLAKLTDYEKKLLGLD